MGKIERIQLRGISRSPSDRMVTDGGCAESLNVQLDHGELVPMPSPDDISDTVFPDNYTEENLRALYIHKGTYYSNYIFATDKGTEGSTIRRYVIYANVNGDVSNIASFEYDSSTANIDPQYEIAEITSVGNTLIISFNGEMRYVLFKYGEYKVLGDHIPVPAIHFYGKSGSVDSTTGDFTWSFRESPYTSWASYNAAYDAISPQFAYGDFDTSTTMTEDEGGDLDPSKWGGKGNGYKVRNDGQGAVLNLIWDKVRSLSVEANVDGKMVFPVFLRYGVRLFDGTMYSATSHILIGADVEKFIEASVTSHASLYLGAGSTSFFYRRKRRETLDDGATVSSPMFSVGVKVNSVEPYFIVADFEDFDASVYDGWEDIVSGVSLFASTPIMPADNASSIQISDTYKSDTSYNVDEASGNDQYFAKATIDPLYANDFEKNLQSHETTYLAKEWTIKDLSAIAGTKVALDDVNWSGDWLATQEFLKETYNSSHYLTGEKLSSYNGRLLLEGVKLTLTDGYPYFPAELYRYNTSQWDYYSLSFKWHINIDGEEKVVFQKTVDGYTDFRFGNIEAGGPSVISAPVAWLTYPDARAYRLDVRFGYYGGTHSSQYKFRTFSTKSFAGSNVAYVFFGTGVNLFNAMDSGDAITEEEWDAIEEDKVSYSEDLISLSAPSNPFIFPAEGVIDFDGANILGTGMATKALSQGQFGQYPLYVFTSSGIWALSVNSEGDFSTKHAVSRDVALEGKIVPIDQAIVFTTKKGVMMLTGSDIVPISPDMNGKHYTLDSESSGVLSNAGYDYIVGASDSDSFMKYMESAIPAYDYAGERIIFCNKNYDNYMYVYRLSTRTWHKMAMEAHDEWRSRVVNVLNSYPETIVSMYLNGYAKAYNLSVTLDQSEEHSGVMSAGLIATRPIDFGLPDIYKSITRVKIRGEVDRSNNHSPFKYILLGSNDGVTWAMLHSLRGPSFKLFRLIILTTLNSTERISYAEIEYEPRFTNKIR